MRCRSVGVDARTLLQIARSTTGLLLLLLLLQLARWGHRPGVPQLLQRCSRHVVAVPLVAFILII